MRSLAAARGRALALICVAMSMAPCGALALCGQATSSGEREEIKHSDRTIEITEGLLHRRPLSVADRLFLETETRAPGIRAHAAIGFLSWASSLGLYRQSDVLRIIERRAERVEPAEVFFAMDYYAVLRPNAGRADL